jgi:acid-sensing ion channel, other
MVSTKLSKFEFHVVRFIDVCCFFDRISRMTAISQVCSPKVFGQIDPKNLTDCVKCVKSLKYIAIRKGDMIAVCYFLKKVYHRDEIFDEVVTEDGICYTFNGIQVHRNKEEAAPDNWTLENGYTTPILNTYPRRAIGVGSDFSLNLYLGLCIFDFDYICRDSAQGFKVAIQRK